MFSNLLFLYERKYPMSYIKQNFRALVTTCKRLYVDKMNGAPVEPFRVRIDFLKNAQNSVPINDT